MWFAILGPLLVHDGEVQIEVPGKRQRVLLAALLVHAGKPVTADALCEVVWDGSPPSGAAATLRSYVLRVRRALGPRAGARVVTQHRGYLLRAAEDEVDALRFRRLCWDGGAALREGSWASADRLLGEALGLWRGVPLADVSCEPLLGEEVADLEELRLQAEAWRADAALQMGRHDELVAELRSRTMKHPLRERFHAQLMLALYRGGRQAEALAAYQHARDVLIEQVGADPGPDLRQLHQQILSADPALAAPELVTAGSGAGAAPLPGPRELPRMVPPFTGRTVELAALSQLMEMPASPGTVVIGGTAGAGKTALAVQWAHQAAGRFPDGQLYVNLHGYDPGHPMPATDALARFLRSLGVPGPDIPAEADERAARYRSLLAGKRMLVVLDNAGSAGQVRPLLPGNPACAVVVTSRDTLPGLVARDGAACLDLDVLPPEDAAGLLRALIGARVAAEPGAAAELAVQCCRLPLALRIAAELAAARPAVPLARLASELADLRGRLDLLGAGGDPGTGVRAVLSWSYRQLDAETARTFRLLGLHPGPDTDPYAVAALTGAAVPQASQALDVLARAHLTQTATPGRSGLHDLLRGYARELAAATDGEQGQRAALTRLLDHYLHTAATAMDILFPAEGHRRPRVPRPATAVPPLQDPAAARDWLDHERAALVTATGYAAAHGWPGHATRLAATLATYFGNGGHLSEAVTVLGYALDAARGAGDREAEAVIHNDMGYIDWQQSRLQQAGDHHRQALALFREAGNRSGEGHALGALGLAEVTSGRYEQAARHQQQAIAIFREIGERFGQARALGYLGVARQRQGRFQEAAGYHQRALGLFREIGDRTGEAWALSRLGHIDLRLGRYQGAADYLRQALAHFHDMGHAGGEAENLIMLGEVHVRLARYEPAAGMFEQALTISRELADQDLQTDALSGLGDVLLRTGEPGKASEHYTAALRLAAEAGSPLEQARAHSGLAAACHTVGDLRQARHHWQEALDRYAVIGAPEADEIRGLLAKTGKNGHAG